MDEKSELFEWGQAERIAPEIVQKFVEDGIKSLSDLARCDVDILLRDYGKSFNRLQVKRFHTSINMLREKIYPTTDTVSCCSTTASPREEIGPAAMEVILNEQIAEDFDDDKDDSYCKAALERAEKNASRACLQVQFDQENDVLNVLNSLILGNDFDEDEVWGKCTQFRKNSKERLKLSKDFHQARAKRILDLLQSAAIKVSNSDVAASPLSPRPRSSSFHSAKSAGQRKGCLKRALSTENRRRFKIQFDPKVLDWVNNSVVQLATEKPKGSVSVSKREEEYERLQRLEREQKEKNKDKWQCSMCKSYSEEKFRRCQVCSSKRYNEESYFGSWYSTTKSYYYSADISSPRSSIYYKEGGVGVGASSYGAGGGTEARSRGHWGGVESTKGLGGGAESSRGHAGGTKGHGGDAASTKGLGGGTESSRGHGRDTKSHGGGTEVIRGRGGGAESTKSYGIGAESSRAHEGSVESSRNHGPGVSKSYGIGGTDSPKNYGGEISSSDRLPDAKVKTSSTSAASTITVTSLCNFCLGTPETSQHKNSDSKDPPNVVTRSTSVPPSLRAPQKAFCQHCFDRERLAGKKYCQICESKKLKPSWAF